MSETENAYVKPTEIQPPEADDILEKMFGAELYKGLPIWMTGQNVIFALMAEMCPEYGFGTWHFWKTHTDAYFMSPAINGMATIQSENGFQGQVTPEAAGLIVTMFALSHLSFTELNDTMSESYHKLREFALDHPEVKPIFAALD